MKVTDGASVQGNLFGDPPSVLDIITGDVASASGRVLMPCRLTISIPVSVRLKIKALAESRNLSVSECVREMIVSALSEEVG